MRLPNLDSVLTLTPRHRSAAKKRGVFKNISLISPYHSHDAAAEDVDVTRKLAQIKELPATKRRPSVRHHPKERPAELCLCTELIQSIDHQWLGSASEGCRWPEDRSSL